MAAFLPLWREGEIPRPALRTAQGWRRPANITQGTEPSSLARHAALKALKGSDFASLVPRGGLTARRLRRAEAHLTTSLSVGGPKEQRSRCDAIGEGGGGSDS